jgi:hypothetical protein
MPGSFVARLMEGLRGYGSRLDDYEMAIVQARTSWRRATRTSC